MSRAYKIVCISAALAICAAAQSQKRLKDQGESDIYTQVTKDVAANDFNKTIADLDTWKQKYPESELKDDRDLLYVQAYAGAKQPAKALDAAAGLLAKDLDAALGGVSTVKLLYTVAVAIQQIPDPSPAQLEVGGKAAQHLLDYNKRPDNIPEEAWTQARAQLQTAARGALLYVALVPGTQAMQRKDCAAAESALSKAIQVYPESAQAAWLMGTAQLCLYKAQPEKASPAIYEFARAAALDPGKGMVDPKWQQATVEPYLEKIYSQYHGPDPEGLKELKALAVQSPLPPAGFKVKSVSEIAQEKQAEFEKTNPMLAMWMKIKGALADQGGEEYFASSMKDAAVPKLRGVLVEARPACHPKELVVAVPLPDAPQPLQPEITLKLDKPTTGAPELNGELQWEGVPTAFTRDPFMLTMDTETAKVEGLKESPCRPEPAKKAPPRKKK